MNRQKINKTTSIHKSVNLILNLFRYWNILHEANNVFQSFVYVIKNESLATFFSVSWFWFLVYDHKVGFSIK